MSLSFWHSATITFILNVVITYCFVVNKTYIAANLNIRKPEGKVRPTGYKL